MPPDPNPAPTAADEFVALLGRLLAAEWARLAAPADDRPGAEA